MFRSPTPNQAPHRSLPAIAAAATFAMLLMQAGCGSGGESGSTPAEPPLPEQLTPIFKGHGLIGGEEPADDGVRVIRTQAELDALPAAIQGQLPEGFVAPDFASRHLLYIEGWAPPKEAYGAATIGIERMYLNSSSPPTYRATAEWCSILAALPSTDPNRTRPYSLFEVSAFPGRVLTDWNQRAHPDCVAQPYPVETLPRQPVVGGFPLIAAGDVDIRLSEGGGLAMTVIRSNEQWAKVLPEIAHGVPEAYRSPDFSATHLILLRGGGDWDMDSYMRILDVSSTADQSLYRIRVEFCGDPDAGVPFHVPYAVYAVDAPFGIAHFELRYSERGRCETAR